MAVSATRSTSSVAWQRGAFANVAITSAFAPLASFAPFVTLARRAPLSTRDATCARRVRCARACAALPPPPSAGSDGPWRPDVQDVDRLSRGQAARTRGTGSRAVPHRLNADERRAYEQAARPERGYVELRGSGYRRERKGAPLANTWRQWCDARARPCVALHKMSDGNDRVVVDVSTLRGGTTGLWWSPAAVSAQFVAEAERLGAKRVDAGAGIEAAWDGEALLADETVDDVWRAGATWELPYVTLAFAPRDRASAKALAAALAALWPMDGVARL